MLVVRGLRRHELLRIAFADLLGQLDVIAVCEAISATTDATLDAALQAATAAVAAEHGRRRLPVRIAVIAMGRLGGMETGYGSDADVMFVYEPRDPAHPGRDDRRRWPSESSPGCARCWPRRRPTRRSASTPTCARKAATGRWSVRWPPTRSTTPAGPRPGRRRRCCGPGSPSATRTSGARFIEMIDPVRYPAEGVSPDQLLEIRRIKGRVDSERLPRGADPATHTKLGRGGLADIEWTVQLLQLSHGAQVPRLRTQQTLVAIHAARDAGLLEPTTPTILEEAWRTVTRARNAIMLVRDKAIDQLPSSGPGAGRGRSGDGVPGRLRPRPADRRLPAGHPAGPPGGRSRSSTATRPRT